MDVVFRSFTREELDQQYDATASIPDRECLIKKFKELSQNLVGNQRHKLDISYGPNVDEQVDLFFPENLSPLAPVHVFLHGGYWYQFTKSEWSFIAEALCGRGAIVAVPTYSLCPKMKVSEIMRQMQRFIVWLQENIGSHGGDPDQIYLSGHSAGGYMAVALLLTDWNADYTLPQDVIKGVTTISGVHDLQPLQFSYLQSKLRLDESELGLLSLSEKLVRYRGKATINCFVGGDETSEFHRQCKDLAEIWQSHNHTGMWTSIAGRNHLDILFDLSESQGPIAQKISVQMKL